MDHYVSHHVSADAQLGNHAGVHILQTIFPFKLKFNGKFKLFFFKQVMKLSLQIFAHATTAQLSWHVQNFVVI